MLGVLLIAFAGALWALDTLIRYPLLIEWKISATQIVFAEHLILALFFFPVLIRQRKKIWQSQISHLFYFFIVGSLGSAIATLAFTKSFGLINPSLAILLQKLQPVVAITMAYFFLKEPVHKKFLYWALFCLIGGIMISYKSIFPGLGHLDFVQVISKKSLLGHGLALLAVFGWGAATVFGKKLTNEGFEEKEIMAGRFTFGLLAMIPIYILQNSNLDLSVPVWERIFGMVILAGVFAMYFYYAGLKRIPARLATLAEMFFPFCAILINWVFLEQSLDWIQISGGAVLLISSTVIQVKHY